MTVTAEKLFTNRSKDAQVSARIAKGAGELGWRLLKSPLTHSLLLTAAITFGIKLDHDHEQTLREITKTASVLSQIKQNRLEDTTQNKIGWEVVGLVLAVTTALRMARASRNPTIDPKNRPPRHELPNFWLLGTARGKGQR